MKAACLRSGLAVSTSLVFERSGIAAALGAMEVCGGKGELMGTLLVHERLVFSLC